MRILSATQVGKWVYLQCEGATLRYTQETWSAIATWFAEPKTVPNELKGVSAEDYMHALRNTVASPYDYDIVKADRWLVGLERKRQREKRQEPKEVSAGIRGGIYNVTKNETLKNAQHEVDFSECKWDTDTTIKVEWFQTDNERNNEMNKVYSWVAYLVSADTDRYGNAHAEKVLGDGVDVAPNSDILHTRLVAKFAPELDADQIDRLRIETDDWT